MFQQEPNPTFPYTVAITVPGRDSQLLSLVFKHKKKSEVTDFLDRARGGVNLSMVREMVHSVIDKKDGQTDEQFLELLIENYPAATGDLLATYLREVTESRLKN